MDTIELAKYLFEIDALDKWGEKCLPVGATQRAEAFRLAEPLWIERMGKTGKLLVHPDVLKELEAQSWVASDLQKRMIWACVLASADGEDSKERFRSIKQKLLRKYGREWWEDVYRRKNNAWAARERIRNKESSYRPAVSMIIANTHLLAGAAADERDSALRMIPRK
jgi:hypothetical protein